MPCSTWSAERIDALRQLWAKGASASEIAKTLGGVTRNAVIGKIHRLGLAGRATPSAPRRERVSRGQTRAPRRDASTRPPPPPASPAVRVRPRTPVVVEAVARVFDARQLSPRICRWPVGDPRELGFGYCGAPVTGKGPYCEPHHLVACPPRLQVGVGRQGARPRFGRVGAPRLLRIRP